MILDSAAAVARASAQVGHPDGAGACLANVYKWFGSVQSIGPGSGHYDWAVKGWNYTPDAEKHPGDWNPPAGVPVYYGALGAPRWRGDVNFPCGDIGLSIGGGYGIFTDGPTGNTAVMSLRARGAQIGRGYLGSTDSFLGHETTAGNARRGALASPVHITNPPAPIQEEPDMAAGPVRAKSKATGFYYNVWEFTAEKFTKRISAVPYSRAAGGEPYPELSSADIRKLLEHVKQRATLLSALVGTAVAAQIQDLLDAEPDVGDGDPDDDK